LNTRIILLFGGPNNGEIHYLFEGNTFIIDNNVYVFSGESDQFGREHWNYQGKETK
jgi:hypothetical protein